MTSQQESQPSPPTVKWWLAVDGETKGPYNQAYAVAMLKSAKIDGTTLACPEGGQQWKPLSDWPAFADAVGQTASPPTTAGAAESQVSSATPATPAAVYAEPAKGDDDSRLLTNPQLPSMANWICIYSIAISPLLWILANGTCCVSGPTFHEASSLFGIEVILTVVFLPIDLAAGDRRFETAESAPIERPLSEDWTVDPRRIGSPQHTHIAVTYCSGGGQSRRPLR